jgi:hypothetical protein
LSVAVVVFAAAQVKSNPIEASASVALGRPQVRLCTDGLVNRRS